jgi:hypothetical protein
LSKEHFERTVKLLIDAGALKKLTPEESGNVLASSLSTRQGPGNPVVLKMLLDAGLSPQSPMPDYRKTGKKNSVIGYYRDFYNQNKDKDSYYVTIMKPMLDILEKADATKSTGDR